MNSLDARFLKVATIYGLIGFAAGVYMGITNNGAITSAHAHLGLLGWLSFMAFSYYYYLHPEASGSRLAGTHFWLANLGLVVMTIGVAMLHSGYQGALPAAAIGSVLMLVSFIVFTVIVFTRPNQRIGNEAK
jgi:cbb3-type cytochrome oxidase subunit 1